MKRVVARISGRWRVLSVAVAFAAAAGGIVAAEVSTGGGSGPVKWLVGQSGINIINSFTGNTSLTTNAFNNSDTSVFALPASSTWISVRTAYYTSYAAFSTAVANGTVPARSPQVMYDNEDWSSTPIAEQQNPGSYERQFVTLAHQRGYRVALTPAFNIVNHMSCFNPGATLLQNYLGCGIPRISAATGADVFEIQAQGNEDALSTDCVGHPASFYCAVTKSATQAHSAAPNVTILAGLSTNHQGMVSSGQNLYTDTKSTASAVQGYWINIPKQSTGCPSCTPDGSPQVAVDYLHLMGYRG